MRVLVNLLNFRPGAIGGTETILRKLLLHLPEVSGEAELKFLIYQHLSESLNLPAEYQLLVPYSGNRLILERLAEAFTPYHSRSIYKHIVEFQPDVVLYPQQSLFPKSKSWRSLMIAVDIQHLIHPERIPAFDRWFRWSIYGKSMGDADLVIAISQYTKQTLLDYMDVPAEKIVVIPCGYEPMTTSQTTMPEPTSYEPYIYYPASTYPHKNHITLFKTIAALREHDHWQERVILTGMQTPHWQPLQKQIQKLGLSDSVLHEGYVKSERLLQLYHHAEAIVFPSLFEGFGLPILEATHWGRKLISSDIPAFRELGVPDDFRIDFSDPQQLVRALHHQEFKGLTQTHITWKEMTQQYWDLISKP